MDNSIYLNSRCKSENNRISEESAYFCKVTYQRHLVSSSLTNIALGAIGSWLRTSLQSSHVHLNWKLLKWYDSQFTNLQEMHTSSDMWEFHCDSQQETIDFSCHNQIPKYKTGGGFWLIRLKRWIHENLFSQRTKPGVTRSNLFDSNNPVNLTSGWKRDIGWNEFGNNSATIPFYAHCIHAIESWEEHFCSLYQYNRHSAGL